MLRAIVVASLAFTATQALAQVPAAEGSAATGKANATFIDPNGKEIGQAELAETRNGVLIKMSLKGISEGEHAFHVHETGKCDASGKFESAGSHFTPGDQSHGHMHEKGPHAGDMPNQFADASGKLTAHVLNPNITLLDGASSVFDNDGSALVLHAGPDDYTSQPAGDAGGRIACAVIEKSE